MTFARIQNNTVFELFEPPAGVAMSSLFAPSLVWVDVSNVAPPPQPGWTATEANGAWTFAPPAPPPAPSLMQQAQAALGAGVAITSTSTPALNGTYACDPGAQANIAAIQVYINTNGKFPGSTGTYTYVDLTDTPHTFPTTAEFQAFATAIADYVSDLVHVQLGIVGSLPSNAVTIP